MIVQEIVEPLALEIAAGATRLDNPITGGYASDLLSCVMAGARKGNVWVTLQAHPNVIAVAELLGLAAVVIAEGVRPSAETIARAESHNIPVLVSVAGIYTVVGQLVQLGIQGSR